MGESGDIHRNIFLALPDGVFLVSRELTITHSNLAAEEMFWVSRRMCEGRPVALFFPGQPQVTEKIRNVFVNGSVCRDVECQGRRKSVDFPASLTLAPMADPGEGVQSVIVIVKDISLLKDLQESSRQMDRAASLGVLALGMAHEIKNPLLAIGGSAQLLLRELSSPDQKKFLEIVISESNRINRMVERMLDFTRQEQLELREVNLHKALDEILVLEKARLEQKSGRFELIYDPSLPLIEADEDKLKQVFLNLIQNAVDASPEGGAVRIVTRMGPAYSLKSPALQGTRHPLVVEISDCGPGIAPEKMQHLFTPFYSTKKKGNGLGLAITLKIVEEHHGKIKIISAPGEGATAQVILPRKQN